MQRIVSCVVNNDKRIRWNFDSVREFRRQKQFPDRITSFSRNSAPLEKQLRKTNSGFEVS